MAEADQLVNQIPLVESATSKITDVDIWDIPLIFGAVIALLGFEMVPQKTRWLGVTCMCLCYFSMRYENLTFLDLH